MTTVTREMMQLLDAADKVLSGGDFDSPYADLKLAAKALRERLAEPSDSVEQPAPTQGYKLVPIGLAAQSQKDLERFLRTTNLAAISKKVAVVTSWRISHQQTKKRINSMSTSDAFNDGDAQNLTLLDVHNKAFLADLAQHAREAAEMFADNWAIAYTALANAASDIAAMIERTEVQDD